MTNPLEKALTTVFILGIVVSFSSLLYLVVFFNFSILPAGLVILSVLVCAAFQLAAFLGGVVFKKQMWPSVLCLLACSVGTIWAGAAGPGALFGMPGTILTNLDRILSNPLYLASLPVTLVGFATGIAYFVLGVLGLLHDSQQIDAGRTRAGGASPKEPDAAKAAVYNRVMDMLGVAGGAEAVSAGELAEDAGPQTEAGEDRALESDLSESLLESAAPPRSEEGDTAEEALTVENSSQAANGAAKDTASAADAGQDAEGDGLPEQPLAKAPIDTAEPGGEKDKVAAEASSHERAGGETSAEKQEDDQEDSAPAEHSPEQGADESETPSEGHVKEPLQVSAVAAFAKTFFKSTRAALSRLHTKITAFLAADQPAEDPAEPEASAEKGVSPETEPPLRKGEIPLGKAGISPVDSTETDGGEPPLNTEESGPGDGVPMSAGTAGDTENTDGESEEGKADSNGPSADEHTQKIDTASPETSEAIGAEEIPLGGESWSAGERATREAQPPAVDGAASAIQKSKTEVSAAEPPAFVTMRQADLLENWAATPYVPVPAEDLSVTLETDRLRITRLNKEDFSALLRGIRDMETAIGLTPSGEQLDPHTIDTFDSLYSRALEDPEAYKWFAVWIIASKAENKLLGSAGFKGKPNQDSEVDLGCGVNEAHRGSCYTGEAVTALCQWALVQTGVQAVTAQTDLLRPEEESLLERAGIKRVKETSISCFWRLEK